MFCIVVFGLTLGATMACPDESVIVDFYADWCAPCQTMAPMIDQLASEGYDVRRVNIDRRPEVAKEWGVQAVPTLFVVSDGVILDRVEGVTTRSRLVSQMQRRPRVTQNAPSSGVWRYESPNYHPSVVRIDCADSIVPVRMKSGHVGIPHSMGSGVLVRWGARLVVLTARHVVRDAKAIRVRLSTGAVHTARLLNADVVWDCAVLQLDGIPQGVQPADLEFGKAAILADGDKLESCGYGPDEKFAVNSGRFIGYRRYSGAGSDGPDDWFGISGHSRNGDSGGPVYNARGRVVGILWGGNDDADGVWCVQAGRLHVAIRDAMRGYQTQSNTAVDVVSGGVVYQHSSGGDEWRPVGASASKFIQRRPTPPMNGPEGCGPAGCTPAGIGPEPYQPMAPIPDTVSPGCGVDLAAKPAGGYVLPYRDGQAAKDAAVASQLQQVNDNLRRIQEQIASGAKQPVEQQPVIPLAPEAKPEPKPETLKEKAEAVKEKIQDKLESQPGVIGDLWKKIDNFDHIWLIVAIIGLFILWKKGGVHHIVESKGEKLKADAEEGGLKGLLAKGILRVHDSPIGTALGKGEDSINAIHDRLSGVESAAKAALHVATQAAVAAVPGGAPVAAAIGAVEAAKAATSGGPLPKATPPGGA
jgi:thioredoxin 1